MFRWFKSLFRKPAPEQLGPPAWKGEREVEALSIMYADWVVKGCYGSNIRNIRKDEMDSMYRFLMGRTVEGEIRFPFESIDSPCMQYVYLRIEQGRISLTAPDFHKIQTFDDVSP